MLQASATSCPCPDESVDVAHARWAYFFGPGCEPGLAELDRVMRPGGTAFVIDNDPSRSTFGGVVPAGLPRRRPGGGRAVLAAQGWDRHPVDIGWTFDSRDDLEAVVRIEFAAAVADEILAGHEGTTVDYAVNVWCADVLSRVTRRWLERRTTREGWSIRPSSPIGLWARTRVAGVRPARRRPARGAGGPRSGRAR